MQGFRIHAGVWRRKFENLKAVLSLRSDQLAVLFGREIQQDAAVTGLDSSAETDAGSLFVIAPPRKASETTVSPER